MRYSLPLLLAIASVGQTVKAEPTLISTKRLQTTLALSRILPREASTTECAETTPAVYCTFTTTVYAASYSSMFDGRLTQSFCNCPGGAGAGIGYMTSGTSTSSYCQTGLPPSPWKEIPSPTPKVPLPVPSSPPTCNDMHTKNWVPGNVMSGAISAFCQSAAGNYTASNDAFYYSKGFAFESDDDNFQMSVYLPAIYDYTFTEIDCVTKMILIQNDCNNDPTGNPMNWKYGGRLDVGSANFVISIPAERYVSGRCRFHIREFSTIPGQIHDDFRINCELFDASGTSVYNTGGDARIKIGQGYVASMPAPGVPPVYYDYLTISNKGMLAPEDLAFKIGDQAWTTNSTTANVKDPIAPVCNVGDQSWISNDNHRDMDCWMSC